MSAHKLTPYLAVRGAADAIAFYHNAFGAKELYRLSSADGKIGHAEIEIDGSVIMLADEVPRMGIVSPQTLGGSSVTLSLYVDDVDRVAEQAIAAGAKVDRPVADQFYGDRAGRFIDPFGHCWWIATRKEELSFEEIQPCRSARGRRPLEH